MQAMVTLSKYHKVAGYSMGGIALLVLLFAFLDKKSIYVRVFALLGIIMVGLAASGGILYVRSGHQDRFALGQMADASIGVFGSYFIQLFFMNRTPRWPWTRTTVR